MESMDFIEGAQTASAAGGLSFILDMLGKIFFTALILAAIAGALWFAHRRTLAYFGQKEHQEFRRQIIMLGLMMFGVLLAIILAPISPELRKDLLGLFGIIISATIALSSTTLVGNAMAGLMLRAIRSYRPGDYIYVGEHSGRITEMDMLHTQIQTEEVDLTTLPNLYMVTHPVRVLKRSGTLVTVEVSLGYDVPRHQIQELVFDAALKAGLEEGSQMLQIRALGDYSVTYAVAGILTKTEELIKTRRALRAYTLDALHGAGIEIASPAIHSVREYPTTKLFVPAQVVPEREADSGASPDQLIFEKAHEAENVEKLLAKAEDGKSRLAELDALLKTELGDEERIQAEAEKARIEIRIERLKALADERKAGIKKD